MWFHNRYHHQDCKTSWDDEYSCTCNDRCPVCNAEIEPESSDDLTVVVLENAVDECYYGRFGVYLSPESAEHDPDYTRVKSFDSETDADAFAHRLRTLCVLVA
jgi:hypothetical protein